MKYIFYCCFLVLATSANKKEEWVPLLDKNMSQWETYLSFSHKNGYKGEPPLDNSGAGIKPIGYNSDPSKVFSIIEENGEPVLK